MPRWTQVKRNGLVITLERRGISSGIALRHLSRPWLHVQSAKDHTREETAFQGVGPRWWILKAIRTDWRCPGVPTQAPILITLEEPWVLVTVEGQSVDFLSDAGAAFFVLTEAPGPLSSWSTTIKRLSGWAKCYYFNHPLSCNADSMLFSHEFLTVPEPPSLFLGNDTLNKVQASIFINMEPTLLIEQNTNPKVWADGNCESSTKCYSCHYQTQWISLISTSKAVPTKAWG